MCPWFDSWRHHKKSLLNGKDFFVLIPIFPTTKNHPFLIQLSEQISFSSLEAYLGSLGWSAKAEHISKIAIAGEGNMNVVLRITTNQRSFILKQSRPFVQKYQDIPAPLERIIVEKKFYETVAENKSLHPHFPEIIGYDTAAYILMMEDLGDCDDMGSLYARKGIDDSYLKKLTSILKNIHATGPPLDFPENREMRKLNHQHIFVLPFLESNGFSLDAIQPGLQTLSVPYKRDEKLKKVVSRIGERYLSKGTALLHGDYYPGSWMSNTQNLYVIDPEFGFIGYAEFDIGVMVAHCILATNQEAYLEKIVQLYGGNVSKELIRKTAGIEIMRRIIGLAQLPLTRTLAEKEELLNLARKMMLS